MRKSVAMLPLLVLFFCGNNAPAFNGDRAFSDLEKQVAFGPRNPGGKGHSDCLEWLQRQLEGTAGRVVLQKFNHKDSKTDSVYQMTNIVASYNLKNVRKRVLLCAHWDTRRKADRDFPENRNKPIPGANDGASGVAVLLELGRMFKQNPPDIGVDIVLFDGEDYGEEGHLQEYFLGSRYFAGNIGRYRPIYGILLDMIGDKQLNIPVEYNSQRFAAQVVQKILDAAKERNYPQFSENVGDAVSDDHLQLIHAGIPCVDLIDFNYPDNSQKYWHTTQDTPDKCSPNSLKIVGQVVADVVYSED